MDDKLLKGFENTLVGFLLGFAGSSDLVVGFAWIGAGAEGFGEMDGFGAEDNGLDWPFDADARRRLGSKSGNSILDR